MPLKNSIIKKEQLQYLLMGIAGLVLVITLLSALFANKPSKPKHHKTPDLAGAIDETFSDKDTESALVSEQREVGDLKSKFTELGIILKKISIEQREQSATLTKMQAEKAEFAKQQAEKVRANKIISNLPANTQVTNSLPSNPGFINTAGIVRKTSFKPIHIDKFSYSKNKFSQETFGKNANNYVPRGTYVKAVVLGGADADASVNAGRNNNAVMLFKLISDGTLPNGVHSHLKGCVVTASSVGDISSERAYVKLDGISCAKPHQAILDIDVEGWAFFGGKVGIKGVPLMRDGKVMWWAGVSGAISGFAKAAQYAQTTQFAGPYGASTSLAPSNVFKYSAAGGAESAMDKIAGYYIKRADQYHPVIQVGAGNIVTIVFKKGFSLVTDKSKSINADDHYKSRLSLGGSLAPELPNIDTSNINISEELAEQVRQAKIGGAIELSKNN